MFEEGNILYFNPFYFENGNTPKPKYFLVLRNIDGGVVLASLPTSHDHIPCNLDKKHGCIDDNKINFNCYYFECGRNIAYNERVGCDFYFPKDTYIYGYRIAFFDLGKFNRQIVDGNTNVEIKGKLYDGELTEVKKCLKNSSSVKRALRRLL